MVDIDVVDNGAGAVMIEYWRVTLAQCITCLTSPFLTCTICGEVPHDLCPLSICSISLPHNLQLNPVSGTGLERGQSVGGVTVGRLGDSDGAILGGVGHSEGVALGVAG